MSHFFHSESSIDSIEIQLILKIIFSKRKIGKKNLKKNDKKTKSYKMVKKS